MTMNKSFQHLCGLSQLMILYHPYIFSFCGGTSIIVSITGIVITFCSMVMFEITKIQFFILTMDLILIVNTCICKWGSETILFWVAFNVIGSIYPFMTALYPYILCYKMTSKTRRVIGNICYPFVLVAFILFGFSCRGILNSVIGIASYVLIIPFISIFPHYQYVILIDIIGKNQLSRSDPNFNKQKRLQILAQASIFASVGIASPAIWMAVLGAIFQNAIILETALVLLVFFGFTVTVLAFLITFNKFIQTVRNTDGTKASKIDTYDPTTYPTQQNKSTFIAQNGMKDQTTDDVE